MDLLLHIIPQCAIESLPLILGTVIYELEIIRFLFFDYPIPPTSPHKSLDFVAAFIPWEVPKKTRTWLGTLVAWVCGVVWFLSEFTLDLVLVALGKSIEGRSTAGDRHIEGEDWMKGKGEWSKKQQRQKWDCRKPELLDDKEVEEEQHLLEKLEELAHLQLSATLELMSSHAKEISLANATKPQQEECEERVVMDNGRGSDAEMNLTFKAGEEEYRKERGEEAVSHSRNAIVTRPPTAERTAPGEEDDSKPGQPSQELFVEHNGPANSAPPTNGTGVVDGATEDMSKSVDPLSVDASPAEAAMTGADVPSESQSEILEFALVTEPQGDDVLDAEAATDSVVEDYIHAVEQDEPHVVHAETPEASVGIMSLDNVSLIEPHIETVHVLGQCSASTTISEESASPDIDIDIDAITEVPNGTIIQESVSETQVGPSDILESVANRASGQGEVPTAETSLALVEALIFAKEFRDAAFECPVGAPTSQASPTFATFGERPVQPSSPTRSPILGWSNFHPHPNDLVINKTSPTRRNSTPLGTSPILKASKAAEITFSSGHSSDMDHTTSEQTTNTVLGPGRKKNKKKKKASGGTAGSVPSSSVAQETAESALVEEEVKEHQRIVTAPENHHFTVETTSATKPAEKSKPSKSKKGKKK